MKHLFTLIHLILLTLAAALVVQSAYQRVGMKGLSASQEPTAPPLTVEAGQKKVENNSFTQQYTVIGSRNLFHVSTDEKITEPASLKNQVKTPESIKITPLQLSLKGTVTGLQQVYAVIEDKKTKKQDFYMAGDNIQGAFLKAVYKDHVVLEVNGDEQRLEMSVESAPPAGKASARLPVQSPETAPQETGSPKAKAPEAPKKTETPELTGQAGPTTDEGNAE